MAMGLSGLCVVHCVATAVLIGLLASAGGFLGKPVVHEVGLTLAMIIGAIALGRGVREHGFM
ncbi:MAG TPA: MerC domain-containing protein, partial [Sphingomicrobium sp.]|nr:MerC domain-containing protein [Sphingomicrobium sp.]